MKPPRHAAWALCLLIVFVLFSFNPANTAWFPKCIFFKVTGWQCAGCGMQRASHALLHGQWLTALHYNAFYVVSLPLIGAFALSKWQSERLPRLYAFFRHRNTHYGFLACLMLWWLVRNIAGC